MESGDYRFEVRARLKNTPWSEARNFSFSIRPPWWKSIFFLTLLGILVGFSVPAIFFGRQRIRYRKAAAEAKIQNELARLELDALRAQMNPHFVFNALNAIMYFVITEDKEKANLYLSKFAYLMRMFLDASKSNYISLAEELELLKLYIELEMLRFKDKFDFFLQVKEELPLDSIDVPSMLLQPFVENAINHGLAHKKEKGRLLIEVKADPDYKKLTCIIEDDGVGREEAARIRSRSLKKHKSHGTKIIQDRMRILNATEPGHIEARTIDLFDEKGAPKGTRVEVIVDISI